MVALGSLLIVSQVVTMETKVCSLATQVKSYGVSGGHYGNEGSLLW